MSGLFATLAVLYALGFTNLFLRTSLGVMAPDLAREMALTPAALSAVSSAFFFAYAAMQVPAGMLLDRFGTRRTLAVLVLFTIAGTAVFGWASSALELILARMLIGVGCAGSITGAFYLLNQRLAPDRVVTQTSALNSFSAFGALCATAPLAVLIAGVGWRSSYGVFTVCVVAQLLAVLFVLREGTVIRAASRESLREILRGVARVIQAPGMKRLLAVGLPLSAGPTISAIWGAPYLKDVYALGDIGRGNMLLVMAMCATLGHLLYGQIARRLNTIKGVLIGGGLIVVASTATLAVLEQPPLPLVGVLFCLIGATASYPMVAFAHARGLVPSELVGRAVAVSNMAMIAAIALMQLVFGWIVGAFTATATPPEHAYRAAFAVVSASAFVAVLIYAPIRDSKPRG